MPFCPVVTASTNQPAYLAGLMQAGVDVDISVAAVDGVDQRLQGLSGKRSYQVGRGARAAHQHALHVDGSRDQRAIGEEPGRVGEEARAHGAIDARGSEIDMRAKN